MYDYTKDQFNDEELVIPSDNINLNNKNNTSSNVNEFLIHKLKFISNEHEVLFSKALLMFKYNKFFGVGPKMFRLDCSNPKYKIEVNLVKTTGKDILNHGCGSHPHNIYLQLLSETGIFGTLPLIFLFIFIIYSLLIISIKKISRPSQFKINQINIFVYISILIPLWPLIPTGSFFNNWVSTINFLCFGFFLFIKKDLIRY